MNKKEEEGKTVRKLWIVVLLFSVLMASCTKKEELSTMEKIQKQLNEMQSYQCTATLKRISNKGTNEYETRQSYQITGEYKLELLSPANVAGNYTIFDGKRICQYNPRVEGKVIIDVPENQQRNELFLGAFIKNYMQSEEVSIAVANLDEGKCSVLEAVIPGGNQYLSTEKLWIDNETLKPVQFIIYNADGKERYVLQYTDFEYDPIFDEKLFQIEE